MLTSGRAFLFNERYEPSFPSSCIGDEAVHCEFVARRDWLWPYSYSQLSLELDAMVTALAAILNAG